MDFFRNDYIAAVSFLLALVGTPLIVVQSAREFGWRRYRRKALRHLETITDLSARDASYLGACVLILLVRILLALFGVAIASVLLVATMFMHEADAGNSYIDAVAFVFLVASSIFMLATVRAARRFSEKVREKIAPGVLAERTII